MAVLSGRAGFYDILLTETFSTLGIDIDIRRLPSERALHEASTGNLDGQFAREAGSRGHLATSRASTSVSSMAGKSTSIK